MSKFQKYDNYKESGLEWLGEIPFEWGVKRVKDNFKQVSEKSIQLEKNTYIPLENIESFSGKLLKKVSNENNEDTLSFKKNDILFNKLRPYLAKVLLAEFDGGISQEAIVMRMHRLSINYIFPKYFLFRFLSNSFISKSNSMTDGVKMPRANPYKIMNLHLSLPPLKTQTKIATYLDTQTQKIDKEIQLLEKKSLKYKELKQTLINETVLRGLDKGVKLKDSGIEWIGDIPEGWSIERINYISKIIRGNVGFKKDELLDSGDYIALQYGKTYKVNEINKTFKYYVNNEFYKSEQVVNFGDIILISTSETIIDLGHSCFYNRNDLGLIGGEQILLKPNDKLIGKKYLYYYSKIFSNELKRYATGLKVFRFNNYNVKNLHISIPPLKDQQKIALYLDEKTQKIDAITKTIQTKITLLKEFRKTLINDVVTGKVKVCD